MNSIEFNDVVSEGVDIERACVITVKSASWFRRQIKAGKIRWRTSRSGRACIHPADIYAICNVADDWKGAAYTKEAAK